MGGIPPPDYGIENQRQASSKARAKVVRHIFRRFVELRSSILLPKELRFDEVTGGCSKGEQIDKFLRLRAEPISASCATKISDTQ